MSPWGQRRRDRTGEPFPVGRAIGLVIGDMSVDDGPDPRSRRPQTHTEQHGNMRSPPWPMARGTPPSLPPVLRRRLSRPAAARRGGRAPPGRRSLNLRASRRSGTIRIARTRRTESGLCASVFFCGCKMCRIMRPSGRCRGRQCGANPLACSVSPCRVVATCTTCADLFGRL
jgi:hypothetical protein